MNRLVSAGGHPAATARHWSVIDTDAVMAVVRRAYAADFASDGVRLDVPGLPPVLGDPAQVRLLFMQLVGNGLRYRSAGRDCLISVTARPAGARISFCVSDNGVGIQAGFVERLFALFDRREDSTAGSGLGRCRQIVTLHGGRLQVLSTPWVGCRYVFSLPAATPDRVNPDQRCL